MKKDIENFLIIHSLYYIIKESMLDCIIQAK